MFTAACQEELSDLLDEKIYVCLMDIGRDNPWRFLLVDRLHGGEAAPRPSSIDARRIKISAKR